MMLTRSAVKKLKSQNTNSQKEFSDEVNHIATCLNFSDVSSDTEEITQEILSDTEDIDSLGKEPLLITDDITDVNNIGNLCTPTISQAIREIRQQVDEEICLCGACNSVLTDKDECLQCDGSCKLWYHKTCAEISDKQFQVLANDETINWLCIYCKSQSIVTPLADHYISSAKRVCRGNLNE